eukprot:g33429.t1
MRPLPAMIASGDLDGDHYFVCWSPVVIGNILTKPICDEPLQEETILEPKPQAAGAFRQGYGRPRRPSLGIKLLLHLHQEIPVNLRRHLAADPS